MYNSYETGTLNHINYSKVTILKYRETSRHQDIEEKKLLLEMLKADAITKDDFTERLNELEKNASTLTKASEGFIDLMEIEDSVSPAIPSANASSEGIDGSYPWSDDGDD